MANQLTKVVALILALLGSGVSLWGQPPEIALRLIAFGDNEGVIARPGNDPAQKNPALPQRLEILRQEDQHTPIDLLLHTGDFVRFDPSPHRHLVELFDRYRGDLVLSGDHHVYGRARGHHTLYLVTGIVGDRAVGGCAKLNNPLADGFLGEYRPCVPGLNTVRKGAFAYHADHYVDLRIHGRTSAGKAVEIADGRVFDTFTDGGGT